MVDIYDIVNLVNGKRYVGITTKGIRKRWVQHQYEGRKGTGRRLYAAMRHYGPDQFRIRLIKRVATLEEAKAEEIRLIAIWKPEYNHSTGGESRAGCKMPRDAVERSAAKHRGKPNHFRGKKHTAEALAKMSAAHKGKRPRLGIKRPGSGLKGAATRRARGTIVRHWLGKTRSEETKKKISIKKTGVPRKPPPEHALEVFRENMRKAARARRKVVKCLNDGRQFESLTMAAIHYGLTKTAISAVANGRIRHTRGLRFIYPMEQR